MHKLMMVGLSLTLLLACSGPIGPIPGGALEGSIKPWPQDWAFTDKVENIFVETGQDKPYSVTLWCVNNNGNLYIASSDKASKWVKNIGENPQVRLNIKGNLYESTANRVRDREEINRVIQAYLTKYEIESDEDLVQEDGVLFRLYRP